MGRGVPAHLSFIKDEKMQGRELHLGSRLLCQGGKMKRRRKLRGDEMKRGKMYGNEELLFQTNRQKS